MTRFDDNILSGNAAITSALASKAPVLLTKTHRLIGASTTVRGTLPTGVQNLDASLYILANGSAATNNTISVSAGGVQLLSFAAFGSAAGINRTPTIVASACANLSTTSEPSYSVTMVGTDAAVDCQVQLTFNRVDPS